MFLVSCSTCADILGRPVAQAFVRRHHALVGHRAVITERPAA